MSSSRTILHTVAATAIFAALAINAAHAANNAHVRTVAKQNGYVQYAQALRYAARRAAPSQDQWGGWGSSGFVIFAKCPGAAVAAQRCYIRRRPVGCIGAPLVRRLRRPLRRTSTVGPAYRRHQPNAASVVGRDQCRQPGGRRRGRGDGGTDAKRSHPRQRAGRATVSGAAYEGCAIWLIARAFIAGEGRRLSRACSAARRRRRRRR